MSPERVERMAREMGKIFADRLREQTAKADAAPAEIQAITDRIERPRDRLTAGDPDLEPDEIQAAIDKAEQKRRELLDTQPAAKQSAKMLAALPKAADAYRRQIAQGLRDDPRAAGKARALLRKLVGTIRLVPEGADLWAESEMQPGVLLRATGTTGSGGAIWMQCRAD